MIEARHLRVLRAVSRAGSFSAAARELGWGGVSLVARATGLSRPTITAGMRELDQPDAQRAALIGRLELRVIPGGLVERPS